MPTATERRLRILELIPCSREGGITLRAGIADDQLALSPVRETRRSTEQTLEHSTHGWLLTARLREGTRRTLTAASRLYESDQTPAGESAS